MLRRRTLGLVVALATVLAAALTTAPARGAEPPPSITITSPTAGTTVTGDALVVRGTVDRADQLQLMVGPERLVPITVDPSGSTWSITVSLTEVSGRLDLAVKGRDLTTYASMWSPFVAVTVDRPAVRPAVTIDSPQDGAQLSGAVRTELTVADAPPGTRVEVRLNGGAWRTALAVPHQPGRYRVTLPANWSGYAAIEARAVRPDGAIGVAATRYVRRPGAPEPAPQPYRQDRAIWVWEPAAYAAVLDPAARATLGRTLDDTTTFDSDPITTIYLGVGRYQGRDLTTDHRAELADFIRWARARGYHVQATVAGGTQPPALGALPAYQHLAVAEFDKVLNFNLAVGPGAAFDGINVDVEPYLLPQWKEPNTQLPQQYLDLLATLLARRDAAGQSILVGPAIPRWFDSSDCCRTITWRGVTKPLSDHVQDLADYISIMDYRDTADGGAGIIAQALHELAYATSIGKPLSVVLGVETKDLAGTGDPETVTFWEEGRTHLEAELDKVYAAFAGDPAFAGIALHHYDSLRALPSDWTNPVYYP